MIEEKPRLAATQASSSLGSSSRTWSSTGMRRIGLVIAMF
jgi:hypothetical protein